MEKVFCKPESMEEVTLSYCPGCTHGLAHRLIAEVMDELNLREKTVGICPVGCAVFAYDYFTFDVIEAAHGRAPAVATGVKRTHPDNVVFTYQGDGDLASIGAAEIVHAAARGENICVFFINNAVYGMTGGQMAPTTLPGMKTTTSPFGREPSIAGYPLKVSELLSSLEGAAYIERVSLSSPANVVRAKKAIRRAFETQLAGKGFSLVEMLSSCPTQWGISPVESLKMIDEKMAKQYPLGVFVPREEKG